MEQKPNKTKPRRTGYRREIAKGKQRIRVFLGRDTKGKRHYRCETIHGGKADADKRIIEILRRHKAGEPLDVSVDTFSQAIDAWLEAVRHSVAETSLKTYKQIVRLYIKPKLGSKMIAQIRKPDVQKMYNELADAEKEKGSGTLSPATIRYIHRVLGMIFKQAVDDGRIQGSPVAGVKLPKASKTEQKAKVLTPEQIARFLSAAKDTRFENLFIVAFRLGCRPTELLALRWMDVNIEARTLTINRNIIWKSGSSWYLKEPKTPASRRTLPITEVVIDAIERERAKPTKQGILMGVITKELAKDFGALDKFVEFRFIFARDNGEPWAQWQLRDDCKLILKKAGLPLELSPYSARHSMATLLLTNGVDVRSVSERLGHTKPATTLNYYAHALPGRQAQVSEEMDRLLEVESE